ncbi:MAG: hypothetical protein LC772_10995, partial [Chloroflexi bacterium]|nr:hypothetical protein [Chloroflexota bacterium]
MAPLASPSECFTGEAPRTPAPYPSRRPPAARRDSVQPFLYATPLREGKAGGPSRDSRMAQDAK